MVSRALIIAIAAVLLSACNDPTVMDNLTQEQANHALAILQQHDIAATKRQSSKTGYAITVGTSESKTALSVIRQYQLPRAASVQISQAFPDSSLVSSPNAEQARVISLQEQRLEQSLLIIGQVVNARVHISYPSFTNELRNKQGSEHVGILISYTGDIEENMFITQIKSLIKNSLENVRYENISVALFPAPMIQHTPSPRSSASLSPFAMTIFSVIVLSVIAAGGGVFYYSRLRLRQSPAADVKGNYDHK